MVDFKSFVQAIRADEKVGEGSCSTIDECFTDEELIELLEDCQVKNVEEALQAAYDYEGLRLEQSLNCRWGEDNDQQLLDYNDFVG